MGAFLPKPKVEKVSEDGEFEHISYGLSGMQGWRMSMEDAHCALPDIDEKQTSLFGVFDGHGGSEVALYVARNISRFVMDTPAFQDGDMSMALKSAFMNIDEAITTKEVIQELKAIAGGPGDDEDAEEEAAALLEEANMPIEEVLQRIKGSAQELLDERLIKRNADSSFDQSHDDEPKVNGHLDDYVSEALASDKGHVRDEEPFVDSFTTEEPGNSSGISAASSRSRKQRAPVKRLSDTQGSSLVEQEAEPSSSTTEATVTAEADSTADEKPADNVLSLLPDGELGDADNDSDDESDEYTGEGDDDDSDDGDDGDEEENEFVEDAYGVDFQEGSDEVGQDSGTTAVVACVYRNKLFVANAGDSRCVLCRGGVAVDMSIDHKPEDDDERERIEKAGGKIMADGRVNGGLNLSRAIGDHRYKSNKDLLPEQQAITAMPDVKVQDLTPEDTFMVLACDGIWNVMDSKEVIDFVQSRLSNAEENVKLSTICEELFDKCLAPNTENDGTGCDNMTCIIVKFVRDGKGSVDTAAVTSSQKRPASSPSENDTDQRKKYRLSDQ